MTRFDAVIVGGGPAGSTCARELHAAGWSVVVIDRATFPRDKVCAGWVTPEVFATLDLSADAYASAGLTIQAITAFRTGVMGERLIDTGYKRVVSYAIRRCEFDTFLLRRSGAHVIDGTPVTTLNRSNGTWTVNETFEAPVLVGAGGHFCPVANHLSGGVATPRPVVARECEFHLRDHDTRVEPTRPELYFCRDLEGYGWCLRKGDFINVGIGRRGGLDFWRHHKAFVSFLEQTGRLATGLALRWKGHAYLASGVGQRPLVSDGALLVGDAAGLAFPESGEGIRPAVESGHLAARTLIQAAGRYERDVLTGYQDVLRRLHPPALHLATPLRNVTTAAGRWLLSSPRFTKGIVLDRWFLRATPSYATRPEL